MSIKAMTEVWEHSQQSGSGLLLLLAIADYTNDEGQAWPSVSTLAAKTRLSVRQVRRLLADVEASGELEIVRTDGSPNRYIIRLTPDTRDRGTPDIDVTPDKMSPLTPMTGGGDTRDRGTPDIHDRGGVTRVTGGGDIAMSPEPLLTTNEPLEKQPLRTATTSSGGGRQRPEEHAAIVRSLEDNGFGFVTEMLADDIDEALGQYAPVEIDAAIRIAVRKNKRFWSYVEGILKRGVNSKPPAAGGDEEKDYVPAQYASIINT